MKVRLLVAATIAFALLSGVGHAQQLSPDQSALVADFSGAAGSLQSTSAAFDHMRAELKSVIEAQQKEAAELIYWRQYFAGLPAPVAKAADIKQLPASVTPK